MTPRCQKQKRTVLHPSLDPRSVIVLRVQTQAGKEGSGRTLHQADLPPPPHQACLLPTPSSLFLLARHQRCTSLLFFPWVTGSIMQLLTRGCVHLLLRSSGYIYVRVDTAHTYFSFHRGSLWGYLGSQCVWLSQFQAARAIIALDRIPPVKIAITEPRHSLLTVSNSSPVVQCERKDQGAEI